MKNNPLIDALAILLCLLAVIAAGHWFQLKTEVNKQQKENLQQNQKRVELVVDKKQTFESLIKITE